MNWLAWSVHSDRDLKFRDFVRELIALRRTEPLLGQSRFLHGQNNGDGTADVQWLRPDGKALTEEDWEQPHTRSFGLLLRGPARNLLILLNAHFEPVIFSSLPDSGSWRLAVNTADGTVGADVEVGHDTSIELDGRAIVLLRSSPK